MNEKKNKLLTNINYNSNDTNSESILNINQINEKMVLNKKPNINYRNKNRTPFCIHDPNKKQNKKSSNVRPKSLLIKEKTKIKKLYFLNKNNTFISKRNKSCSKLKKNMPKIKETEKINNNFHNSIKRAKSIKYKLSNLYSSFNNILLEYIPVTGKVFNIPKKLNLDKIFNKINLRIDEKTFICLKYNKKTGDLFIKFRNKYYFNYYYYYFKNKIFFHQNKPLKMIKIEETNGLWDINPKEEELKKLDINNDENKYSFYKYYISIQFRRISPYK